MSKSLFDTRIHLLDGTPLDWMSFKNKKIFIVNVASECGFTNQYAQLEELYQTYKQKLVVLGCPCNDFGGQEPGDANTIASFCSLHYHVTFPMTEKIHISNHAHELYQWLMNKDQNGTADYNVVWNFHKFLINSDGSIYKSLPSAVSPLSDEVLSWLSL